MEKYGIRVVIADDHPSILLGVRHVLSASIGIHVVGEASNPSELIQTVQSTSCDVVVTDYAMPGGTHGDGLALLDTLRERYPDLRVIVMTGMDQPVVIQSLYQRGITHILSKADDTSHVPAAIAAAWANRRYLSPSVAQILPHHAAASRKTALSPREREVLTLFVSGLGINEIAERLDRRKQTISTQKRIGMAKLGIDKEADLFKFATELGLRSNGPDPD